MSAPVQANARGISLQTEGCDAASADAHLFPVDEHFCRHIARQLDVMASGLSLDLCQRLAQARALAVSRKRA